MELKITIISIFIIIAVYIYLETNRKYERCDIVKFKINNRTYVVVKYIPFSTNLLKCQDVESGDILILNKNTLNLIKRY